MGFRMNKLQRVLVIGALMATTAVLAVAPGSWSPLAPLADDWIPSLDHRHVVVMAHLVGFAALVMVLTWISGRLLWSAIAVFLFSASLEVVQSRIAWRNASWEDLGLNVVAVVLGVGAVWAFRWLREGRAGSGS